MSLIRQSWDEYFMSLARVTATRSTCKRLAVGAIIVKNNRIISTGYNGSVHGHDHCTEEGCLINDEGRCIRTIHAEMNAILHANRDDLLEATIYTTHQPCENCSKHIAQAGIKKIIYDIPYLNKYSKHFLEDVEVSQL